MKSLLLTNKFANNCKISFKYRPIIPGLICGIFVIVFPYVTGLGIDTIKEVAISDLSIFILIMILFLKLF